MHDCYHKGLFHLSHKKNLRDQQRRSLLRKEMKWEESRLSCASRALVPRTWLKILVKSLSLACPLPMLSVSFQINLLCIAKYESFIKYSWGKNILCPLYQTCSIIYTQQPQFQSRILHTVQPPETGIIYWVYFGCSFCLLLCIQSNNPWPSHFIKYLKDLTLPLLNGGRTPTNTMKTGSSS